MYMYVLWEEEEEWRLFYTWQLETKRNKAGDRWMEHVHMYVMKYA